MHWSFVWFGYLLTWVAIPHILLRNKPPASTLAWIWAVILFPYVGTIFYFIFGTDRLVRQKLRATREMDASGVADHRLLAVTVHHDYGEPNVVQPTVYVTIIERVTPPVPSRS